jgi:hypothetical protein
VIVRRRRLEGRGCRVGRFFGFLRWPLCFVIASLRSEVLQNLEYAGSKVAEVAEKNDWAGMLRVDAMVPCMNGQSVFQSAPN